MTDRDYMRRGYDGSAPRNPFWATYPATKGLLIGLVAIHVLMAMLKASAPDAWLWIWRVLSLQPDLVLNKFFIWQLATAALLHAQGMWHLLLNCIIIFFFGRIVEQRLGMKRYLLFCLGATVTASLFYLLWGVLRTDLHPMLGASGLGMGLLALAALWYPHMTVLLFFVLPMPLWILAIALLVIELLQALSADSNIAHTAHLGGALYGWIYYRYGARIDSLFRAIDRNSNERRRKKERRRAEEEQELRCRLDLILDKVNKEGMPALSDEERRFLKRASARLRR